MLVDITGPQAADDSAPGRNARTENIRTSSRPLGPHALASGASSEMFRLCSATDLAGHMRELAASELFESAILLGGFLLALNQQTRELDQASCTLLYADALLGAGEYKRALEFYNNARKLLQLRCHCKETPGGDDGHGAGEPCAHTRPAGTRVNGEADSATASNTLVPPVATDFGGRHSAATCTLHMPVRKAPPLAVLLPVGTSGGERGAAGCSHGSGGGLPGRYPGHGAHCGGAGRRQGGDAEANSGAAAGRGGTSGGAAAHVKGTADRGAAAGGCREEGSTEATLADSITSRMFRCFKELKEWGPAAEALEAIPASRRSAATCSQLGRVYEHLTNWKRATACYTACLAANPMAVEAAQGLVRLGTPFDTVARLAPHFAPGPTAACSTARAQHSTRGEGAARPDTGRDTPVCKTNPDRRRSVSSGAAATHSLRTDRPSSPLLSVPSSDQLSRDSSPSPSVSPPSFPSEQHDPLRHTPGALARLPGTRSRRHRTPGCSPPATRQRCSHDTPDTIDPNTNPASASHNSRARDAQLATSHRRKPAAECIHARATNSQAAGCVGDQEQQQPEGPHGCLAAATDASQQQQLHPRAILEDCPLSPDQPASRVLRSRVIPDASAAQGAITLAAAAAAAEVPHPALSPRLQPRMRRRKLRRRITGPSSASAVSSHGHAQPGDGAFKRVCVQPPEADEEFRPPGRTCSHFCGPSPDTDDRTHPSLTQQPETPGRPSTGTDGSAPAAAAQAPQLGVRGAPPQHHPPQNAAAAPAAPPQTDVVMQDAASEADARARQAPVAARPLGAPAASPHPRSPRDLAWYAHVLRGEAALFSGDWATAEQEFRRLNKQLPHEVTTALGLARALHLGDDLPAAAAAFEGLRAVDPSCMAGLDEYARVLLMADAGDALRRLTHEVMGRDVQAPEAWAVVASFWQHKREFGKALAAVDRGLQLHPEHVQLRLARGDCLLSTLDPEAALAEFRRVLLHRPCLAAFSGAVAASLQLRRENEALLHARSARTRLPKHAAAHALLGDVYLAMETPRDGEAKRQADRALELQPGHEGAVMVLARVHAQRGRYQAALELLQGLLNVRRSDMVHVRLGDVYRQAGKWQEAVCEYQHALGLNEANEDAKQALEDMSMLHDGRVLEVQGA